MSVTDLRARPEYEDIAACHHEKSDLVSYLSSIDALTCHMHDWSFPTDAAACSCRVLCDLGSSTSLTLLSHNQPRNMDQLSQLPFYTSVRDLSYPSANDPH